jgi:predicted dehydrogenase
MRVAFIGCGYVADLYARTLPRHPGLELAGVMDRDAARAARFAAHHRAPVYWTLDHLLGDPSVDLVVNLTNPRAHYDVSRACLEAGKHVYTEKPLAMDFVQARELIALAAERRLLISSAPCNVLGETAQTIWKAIRSRAVGTVRLAYAEMDDGLLHRMPYRAWASESGSPWPWKDELEVGCTIEHAGYYLTWLAAFFGPAESITSFAAQTVPDKRTDQPLNMISPDFSVACLRFRTGVVARLTCGIVAPHDHRFTLVGDEGVISTDDCWNFRSPVHLRRYVTIRRSLLLQPWRRRVPLAGQASIGLPRSGATRMDFARGIADMARAIADRRAPRLSPDFCLHVCEATLAIHNALANPGTHRLTTAFDPVEPMEWARP